MEKKCACTLIFIGPSGCGKGTQIEAIREVLERLDPSSKINLLETGKYLRKLAEGNTTLSVSLKLMLANGKLASDHLVNTAVGHFLSETPVDNHVIFDGYPRTLKQAIFLDGELHRHRNNPVIVINIKASDNVVISRMVRRGVIEKRTDDSISGIAERLSWFKTEVTPVIEFYKDSKSYHYFEINGEETVEKVFEDIMSFCLPFFS